MMEHRGNTGDMAVFVTWKLSVIVKKNENKITGVINKKNQPRKIEKRSYT